jgi:hypothetical protein
LHLAQVVTLVDAVNGADNLDRFAEAGRQAALADTLVITKTDLAPLGPDLVRPRPLPFPPKRGGSGSGRGRGLG